MKIDPEKKQVLCQTDVGTNFEGNGEFVVKYDYLVIAVGAKVNTFNIPGVEQHCYFLKVISHDD